MVNDPSGRATARAGDGAGCTGGTRRERCVCDVKDLPARTLGDDDEALLLLFDAEPGECVSVMHAKGTETGSVVCARDIRRATLVFRFPCHATIVQVIVM
jgi:hypothetical protein